MLWILCNYIERWSCYGI